MREEVAVAVPLRGGLLLVARRAEGSHLAGTWEFPGGRILPGEDPATAARRELREETGLVAGEMEPLAVVLHDYADRGVRLHCFLAREPVGEVRMDGPREWAWVRHDEIVAATMPAANLPILRALAWRLRS